MAEMTEMKAGPSNASDEAQQPASGKYFFIEGERANFCLGSRERIVLAKHAAKPKVTVAIRIRKGSSGHSEWMNELQVYQLPNFRHKNILPFFGSERHFDGPTEEPFSSIGAYIKRSCIEEAEILLADVGKRVKRADIEPIKLRDPESSASGRAETPIVWPIGNNQEFFPAGTSTQKSEAAPTETSSASTVYDDEPPTSPSVAAKKFNTRDACTQTDREPTHIANKYRINRLEYWIMTRYCDSVTLREYLRENTLTWPQLIKVARGIFKGLYFLHENAEFQNWDNEEAIDGFIRSTNGALRRLAFKEATTTIHMKPHPSLTIIHRNLNSLNIVLKRDLTPCIWNFGHSFVHCPFQPTNNRQFIDAEIKKSTLTSPYTPPEVLQERGHLSLAAMKSIDMYASGILLWELMARCTLPKLEGDPNTEEQMIRSWPEPYQPPLFKEVGESPPVGLMDFAVRKRRVRPRIKLAWEAGKSTRRLCQTIRDLWDHDYDARLHPATVIDRLNRLSQLDKDERCKPSIYRIEEAQMKPFKKPRVWPRQDETSLGIPALSRPMASTKQFDDRTLLPVERQPEWMHSDSGSDNSDGGAGEIVSSVDGFYDEFNESLALMRTLEQQQIRKQQAKERALTETAR